MKLLPIADSDLDIGAASRPEHRNAEHAGFAYQFLRRLKCCNPQLKKVIIVAVMLRRRSTRRYSQLTRY
jgi:hypothetical protein